MLNEGLATELKEKDSVALHSKKAVTFAVNGSSPVSAASTSPVAVSSAFATANEKEVSIPAAPSAVAVVTKESWLVRSTATSPLFHC